MSDRKFSSKKAQAAMEQPFTKRLIKRKLTFSPINKKAQAAMEFLMTYGWAILVVLVVIGTLTYFGVGNSETFLPEKCYINTNLACEEYILYGDEASFLVRNLLSNKVTITIFRLLNEKKEVVYEFVETEDNKIVIPGGKTELVKLSNTGKELDDKEKFSLYVTYYEDSAKDFAHTTEGELIATIESGGSTGGGSSGGSSSGGSSDSGETTPPEPLAEFISTWNTELISESSSDTSSVKLPLVANGIYNFEVDWGDDTGVQTITAYDQPEVTHTYSTKGIYDITITGEITGWHFVMSGDKLKIIDIKQWGPLRLVDSPGVGILYGGYFRGCTNLRSSATDALDLTDITILANMFAGATNFDGEIGNWDVSKVTDMWDMFYYSNFNQDISNWDVGSVTKMHSMFAHNGAFNQDISNWNVSNVVDMGAMFYAAGSFNQNIGQWDVSNVIDMGQMFGYATKFNQNIGSWDVGNVINMQSMFYSAFIQHTFDQDISNWDVSSVTDMSGMFGYGTDQSAILSTNNYDLLLNKWSTLPLLQSSVTFNAGKSKFCDATARNALEARGWTITDGGPDTCS